MKKIILTILTVLLLICMTLILIINANAIKKFYSKKQQYKGTLRLSQSEKDIYNAKIKPYVNNGVKGSDVKSMIDEIISMNQSNVGEDGKFIGIQIKETIQGYSEEDSENLKKACEQASSYNSQTGQLYENPTRDNTESNVKNATENITKLKRKINSQNNYNVEGLMDQGIYTWIIISEAE